MTEPVQASGGCLCGAVKFTVTGTPVGMVQCHCLDCQRASGAGHTSNAIFREADVQVMGTTSSFASKADSGNTLTRHFCPTCGGRVFLYGTALPGLIVMSAGAFDDSSWFEPQAVLFKKRQQRWDITTDKVPAFEAGPPASK